ncbi:MAG: AAA family ATPase, partial [Actinomycetota bacterium]|nr:AAA family ATPase [Actinomycetota bacterium]
AALVATDHVGYRVHPGVVEAIHASTPEPVTAAVDEQLAAWWTAVVGGWETAPLLPGEDASQAIVRANLAGARYLLRRHDWDVASCLLERALIQDGYSPATALAVMPLLRRIAQTTGALKDLGVLGAALRKVDPAEAETVLRRAYYQAITDGEHQLASTTAGELVTLLRDQARLCDALAMASQKIEHTSQAGFGLWTQLSDQGRRLQILNLLDHHEQILTDLPALRAQMAELSDQRAHNDRVNPWNVRECILDIGRLSALALERWDTALDLNDEIVRTKQRRGASTSEIAGCQCQDYLPLFQLGWTDDADQLLRDCQDVFVNAGDMTQLAGVYGARADLEDKRHHRRSAVDLQRISLHLRYLDLDPREIATAHHNLANYLCRASGKAAEQRAHRLAAALLNHLIGNTHELTSTLEILANELRSEASGPDPRTLPATLPEVIRLVDADNGTCFGNLVDAVCPNRSTAEHALADLISHA